MTTITEIQNSVRNLRDEDLNAFTSWFDQFEEEHWDRQIDNDQKAGPLRSLMKKARVDFEAGKCRPL